MKIYILLFLVAASIESCAQNHPDKVLYCNRDSAEKWDKESDFGFVSGDAFLYRRYQGKLYQDTTKFPPTYRIKLIGDTIVFDTNIQDEDIALKVSSCQNCPIRTILAVKRSTSIWDWRKSLYKDLLTGKHYIGNSGFRTGGTPVSKIEYLSQDKKTITNLLIFPNN